MSGRSPYEKLPAEDAGAAPVAPASGSVVVIGNFDGVHRGHQAVVGEARAIAAGDGLPVFVLTFDPHPAVVLGRGEPLRLSTLERRADLLLRAGADRVLVRAFDRAFAAWTPERFVETLLVGQLAAKHVIVGKDFRFGAKRAGDFAKLAELGATHGFRAHAHHIAGDERGPFSSSRVRAAVSAGDVREAAHVLGRPHSFSGVVAKGKQLGRTLGFPTANVAEIPELTPRDGIYAVVVDELTASGPRALARGALSIGVRPTIEGAEGRTHEVFLFDLDRDLYGVHLRVHVIERLRDELRFDGLDALVAQMHLDVAQAKEITSAIEPVDGAFGR